MFIQNCAKHHSRRYLWTKQTRMLAYFGAYILGIRTSFMIFRAQCKWKHRALKIKIDAFGNHKGNVTYSRSFQVLLSPAVGPYAVIPISYKLGRTLCPFGIVIARISVCGGRKESLHSTKESSSWIPKSQSFSVSVLPKERDASI